MLVFVFLEEVRLIYRLQEVLGIVFLKIFKKWKNSSSYQVRGKRFVQVQR
jgi:hypothetical protein